ncbi:hypothetical protein D3C75_1140290 [compost metagenome]
MVKCKIGVGEEAKFFTSNGKGDCELGFDNFKEVLTEGLYRNIIEKSGTKVECDFLDLSWKSELEARKYFKNNPEEFEKLVQHLNEKITEVRDDDEEEDDE